MAGLILLLACSGTQDLELELGRELSELACSEPEAALARSAEFESRSSRDLWLFEVTVAVHPRSRRFCAPIEDALLKKRCEAVGLLPEMWEGRSGCVELPFWVEELDCPAASAQLPEASGELGPSELTALGHCRVEQLASEPCAPSVQALRFGEEGVEVVPPSPGLAACVDQRMIRAPAGTVVHVEAPW